MDPFCRRRYENRRFEDSDLAAGAINPGYAQ